MKVGGGYTKYRQKLRILLQINLALVQVCYTSALLFIELLSFAG